MLKKIFAYALVLTMVLSLFGGIIVSAEEAGVVYKFDSENLYNKGLNGYTDAASMEDGAMKISGDKWYFSTKLNSTGYGATFISKSNKFTKVVFKAKAAEDAVNPYIRFGLTWSWQDTAGTNKIIEPDNVYLEAGSDYKYYEYSVKDKIEARGMGEYGVAMMGINAKGSTLYIEEILFVTDEWTEPEIVAPVDPAAATVYKFDSENLYNKGLNGYTDAAPMENGAMKISGDKWYFSTKLNSTGYGATFISRADKFTKVVFKAKAEEGSVNPYIRFGLTWSWQDTVGSNKIIEPTNVNLEAGSDYKYYVCDLKDVIEARGMGAYGVAMMGMNPKGSTLYIEEILFVTDDWTEPEIITPQGPGSIVSTLPANNAVNVSVDSDIELTIDEIPDLATFTSANIKINGSSDLVKDVIYDANNAPDKITIDLEALELGKRYIVEFTDVKVGTSTFDYRTVFTTGRTVTNKPLLHYDLTTTNTYNPDGLSIVDGGMYVPDHKIYYGPSNPSPGGVLFDFAKLDKVLVTCKASAKMDLIFYLMGDSASSNNVNYAAVTNDCVRGVPQSDDYVTYEIDFSDNVANVLASNQAYKWVRQIAIQHGLGEMYISDIKFVSADYEESEPTFLTAGFEMVKDFGELTEANLSNGNLPGEVCDISATLNVCSNLTDKPANIILAAALYEGNRLVKVVPEVVTLDAGEYIAEPMIVTLEDVPVGGNYVVKGFLWNNFAPVADSYILN